MDPKCLGFISGHAFCARYSRGEFHNSASSSFSDCLIILTLPITILTLGLFIIVINGLLFYGVGSFLQGFEVKNLMAGILGALSYSVLSWLFAAIVIDGKNDK